MLMNIILKIEISHKHTKNNEEEIWRENTLKNWDFSVSNRNFILKEVFFLNKKEKNNLIARKKNDW